MGDVLGGIGDFLDRPSDLEDVGHVLGVLGTSGRQDRESAQSVEVVEHAVFEAPNFLGEVRVGKEDRRVGKIDHQAGGVLYLRKEPLTVLGPSPESIAPT